MSDSNLISYTKLSPNCNSPRSHVIDTITIHCMGGNLSIEDCGAFFSREDAKVSSNYGIDSDGRIALYVHEENRAWTSGGDITINGINGRINDHRAITIEVANDGNSSTGWHVSDKAIQSLIALLADICKRNNMPCLKWKNDKSLIGNISEQNMTIHKWFNSKKTCPGDYLINMHPYIVQEVNKMLLTTQVIEKCKDKYYAKYIGNSGSIVDALNALNVDSSYKHRKKIASANCIEDYQGTNAQNAKLLALIKSGKLIIEK